MKTNLIQNLLIKCILAPISKITSKISIKTKDKLFFLANLMLFLVMFTNEIVEPDIRYLLIFAIGCALLSIMILCILNDEIKPIKFDKKLTIPWAIITIFMLISSVLNNFNYISESLLFLAAYPVFFIVANNADYSRVFRLMNKAAISSFFVFVLISYFFFPITPRWYAGLFANPNGVAFYLVIVFTALFVETLNHSGTKKMLWVKYILMGMCMGFALNSNSRTGQLAILVVAIGGIIIHSITHKNEGRKKLLNLVLPLLVTSVFFSLTLGSIFESVKYLYMFINMIFGDIIDMSIFDEYSLKFMLEFNAEKYATHGTSGRVYIWQAYIDRLNLLGNDYHIKFRVPDAHCTPNTAHSTQLDVAYFYGIIAGAMYLFYNICAGLKSIKFALTNKTNVYALVPFVYSVGFGAVSVVSSHNFSFVTLIALYYYLVQAPIMRKEMLSDLKIDISE